MHTYLDHDQLRLSSKVRYRAVDEDGVLVHLDKGRVLVVNEVGLHILQELDSPRSRKDLVNSIIQVFDIDQEQAEEDLDLYLKQLDREEVLEHHS